MVLSKVYLSHSLSESLISSSANFTASTIEFTEHGFKGPFYVLSLIIVKAREIRIPHIIRDAC